MCFLSVQPGNSDLIPAECGGGGVTGLGGGGGVWPRLDVSMTLGPASMASGQAHPPGQGASWPAAPLDASQGHVLREQVAVKPSDPVARPRQGGGGGGAGLTDLAWGGMVSVRSARICTVSVAADWHPATGLLS